MTEVIGRFDLLGFDVTLLNGGPPASFSVQRWEAPPGAGGIPVHLHRRTEEAFYVIDGEIGGERIGSGEDSIPKLKDEVDGDLFMHGGGEFAYALAEKGLIDEYELHLNPLVGARESSTCSATAEPSGRNSTT